MTAYERRVTALSFNGVNQRVVTASVLSSATTNITIEAWVKINAYPSGNATILYQGNGAINGYGFLLNNAGLLTILHGGVALYTTSYTMPLGVWLHIAYKIESNSYSTAYINGREIGNYFVATNAPSGIFETGSISLNGEIDEVRFWNVARTQNQIRENMHLTLPNGAPNLTNYYQFNDNPALGLAKDGIGGMDGTLINAPTWVASGANVSKGVSFTVVNPATNTDHHFTGTNLLLNFGNATGGEEVVVSRLEGEPTGTQLAHTTVFGDHYWVVNNFGANQTNLNIKATVTLGANKVSTSAAQKPYQVKLNQRVVNSGGYWKTLVSANTANPSNGAVVFEGNSNMLEFVISEIPANLTERRVNAMTFNTPTSYIATPDNDDGLTNFTIESWVNWTPSNANNVEFLFGKAIEQMELHLGGIGANSIRFIPQNGVYIDAYNAMPTNEWAHLAIVYNSTASVCKIYVNGREVISAAITGNISNTPNDFIIGMRGNGTFHLNGMVDEFRIWNVARTQAQIRETMHLTLPTGTANLIHYYQFNELTPQATTLDGVGGLNATINGGATWSSSGANASKGNSFTVSNPNTATNYDFTGTNLSLNFGNSAGTGDVVASRLEGEPTGTQVTSSFLFDDYYWIVNNFCTNNLGLDVTAQFTLGANVVNVADESTPMNIVANKRTTNSGGAWPTIVTANSAVSNTGLVKFSGINSFSEFVIAGAGSSVLPVTLIRFSGKRLNIKEVLLEWATASERNNKGFDVEMSDDGKIFRKVTFVAGQGNSSKLTNYRLAVANEKGAYYRLKQVDFDGNFEYSATVFVAGTETDILLHIYPNPSAGLFKIEFLDKSTEAIDYLVLNASGQEITSGKWDGARVFLDLRKQATGLYLLKIVTDKQLITKQIVIQR